MTAAPRTATPTERGPEPDVDVVVVGSGFGGSVAALRLSEKGYRVHVIEAGRRFEDEDFARTSWDLRRFLWAPFLGCYGVQRIHKLPDVLVLAGAGVGGGSLNYANTLYVPPAPFFQDRQWGHITDWQDELAPHYDVAQSMLGVVTNACEGPVEDIMRGAAHDMGVPETFRKTPVGVFFGMPGVRTDDPYFDGDGPARTGCTECGNCMVGCRVGAKNTLRKNYLAFAERLGATIEPLRTVTRVGIVPGSDPDAPLYRVRTERTDRRRAKDPRVLTARHVVVAAGTWGTQTLLHAMKAEGELPGLSDRLGELTRTNSEALLGAMTAKAPTGVDLTEGVAITSSFHPDGETHVENVRYGKGSNAMGLLTTLLVPGDTGQPRPVAFVKALVTQLDALGAWFPPAHRFSEKTLIALVMQTRDNSITVSSTRSWFGRRRLTSRQGHGEPNPTFIPAGHAAVTAMGRRLSEVTGQKVFPGGTWTEVVDVPMTAHFLGGAPISDAPESGVVDPYHRVWGHPRVHVVDGSAVSANLGVNPSLTITAQAERAFALWPNKGEDDPRPAQGEAYVRLAPVEPMRRGVRRFTHASARLRSHAG
ncbi:GMC oxidoreductase [Janibacter sp. G1551]|uniref:GMC oxidoreductase n=1 Tax=Janibacter sp. G1551 TaxID=3420440 RepID=UPI003D02FC08